MAKRRALEDMRERAHLFDLEAERYDRARPNYPDELIDVVLGPTPEQVSVLDIASGTGIASRQLSERGATVLGIELNPNMAAVAQRRGTPTEVSSFEEWDPAGRTFDVVTCAQGWYWLDQGHCAGKAAAALRRKGRLCLFWNVGYHPDKIADALEEIYSRLLPPEMPKPVIGYAAHRSDDAIPESSAVSASLRDCDDFLEPISLLFAWTRRYDTMQWVDELRTHSDHAALSPEVRSALLGEIARELDAFGGTFEMKFTSVLVAAQRR